MSIKKMIGIYDEFQAILKIAGEDKQIIDNLDEIAVNIEHQKLSLNLLKTLNEKTNYFDVHCNPFPDTSEDIIMDIESGSMLFEEIDSISIHMEKAFIIGEMANIDYFFTNIESALNHVGEIDKNTEGYKVNIGIPYCNPVITKTLNVISLEEETDLLQIKKMKVDKHIENNIHLYLSYNKRGNHNYYYNPYTFIINDEISTHRIIQEYFYKTMLEGLSDKISTDSFIIRGEKTVHLKKSRDFTTDNYRDFIWILNFLISEEKYMEKYLITKRVLSFYIVDNMNLSELDSKMSNIGKTIKHYYNHYIEDDIKDFFKTKDQLLKEAMNVSKVIYEQTDKINNSITASLFSLIILLVSTLYGMIDSVTLTKLTLVLLVFGAFSILYYSLTKKSSIKRYDLTNKQFTYFIDEMSLIKDSEIDALKEVYLEKPFAEMKNTIKRLSDILFFINMILFISYIAFLCLKGYL